MLRRLGHIVKPRLEQILPYTDLFLYDIKLFDPQKHRQYVGTGNERILENLKKLFSSGAHIQIRIPIIPGVNNSEGEMQAIRHFLTLCGKPEKLELLPYHAMGEHKYQALGQSPQRFQPPDKEQTERLRECFGGLSL